MGTIFDVPCPQCGDQMTTESSGGRRCPGCKNTYHARMGVLVPVDEWRAEHSLDADAASVSTAGHP